MEHEEEMQREAAFFCSSSKKMWMTGRQMKKIDQALVQEHHMSWIDVSTAQPKQTRTLCIQMCVVHKLIDQEYRWTTHMYCDAMRGAYEWIVKCFQKIKSFPLQVF